MINIYSTPSPSSYLFKGMDGLQNIKHDILGSVALSNMSPQVNFDLFIPNRPSKNPKAFHPDAEDIEWEEIKAAEMEENV